MASLNDTKRLNILETSGLLDSVRDPKLDRFTQLLTVVLDVPVCLLSLVTEECQFFKSESGLPEPWCEERTTPLSHSFCRLVVETEQQLIVEDSRQDERVRTNPSIKDLNVLAYAGFPVSSQDGTVLGSLCIIDDKPRQWTIKELSILKGFAEAIESEIGLRLELAHRKKIEGRLETDVLARTAELTEALKKSRAVEERFQTLMERTPQAIAMFDRNMCYLDCSERWIEDYQIQDFLPLTGRCHYDIFPGLPERWKEHHRRVLQGESLRSQEDSFLRANGRREWVKWELVPWREPGGDIGGIIMLTEVLTERRLEQAELRRKYVELQEASERLAQAQKEGKLLHWTWESSTSKFYLDTYRGDTRVELTLEGLLDQIRPEYHQDITEKLRSAESHDRPMNLEVTTKEGRVLLFAGSGLGDRVAGVSQDITELRNLKRQVQESQKMESLGLLASGLAHDLNNILCSILLPTEMLQEEFGYDQPDLTLIYEAGKRAQNLVRQLLLFSRREPMKARIVDMNSVVENFQTILSRLLPKRITLKIQPAESAIPKVKIDPSAMEQVLLNLVVNAKDSMPEEGVILVKVELEGSSSRRSVVVSVRDSGQGIPPEIQSQIFQPFFTTKMAGEGTGLGLSVCATIVKDAGGNIRVDSAPDKGTCFSVELPYVEDSVTQSEVPKNEVTPAPRGDEKVFVVDDDSSIRIVLEKFLASKGYKVNSFELHTEALEALNESGCDLLITEVQLPGIDGRELAAEARVSCPNLRTVLTSPDPPPKVLGDSNLFLQKPFAMNRLGQVIREALDSDRP